MNELKSPSKRLAANRVRGICRRWPVDLHTLRDSFSAENQAHGHHKPMLPPPLKDAAVYFK